MPPEEPLAEAWRLYENRNFAGAMKRAFAELDSLQGSDLRDAHRLLGRCSLHQRTYGDAANWLQAAAFGSDEAMDWLQLAIAAVLAHETARSREAFEQMIAIQSSCQFAQGPGYYRQLAWYASALCEAGELELALPLLNELAAAYHRVHTTTPSHLYVAKMPMLATMLELVVRYFRTCGQHTEGVAWLQALSQGLDDEGQRRTQKAIAELLHEGGLMPGSSASGELATETSRAQSLQAVRSDTTSHEEKTS